ncbi:ATP-binding protein [Candidatus Saccharibacteria bacterium]|nr:ATP-binding protein [Candidatus Saccharibacteria bacterium]
MNIFLSVLLVLFILAAIAAPIVFFMVRKSFREQKNFERGLKMVPLLIHLPPTSDDTEGGGRDVRDVTEETISKAQIIYNIISSSFQKGTKNRFYGQRHFGFEIVGSKGFVHFYAAVPVALVETVKQGVISAYPSARLEEVSEHNIFSPVGKISGTIGGELTLRENYAYPIATYQDLKRDTMQAILNALSTLDKEDGVGIQILMRPADPSWRKKASEIASQKRKGKDAGKGAVAGGILKDLATAVAKPPESKDDKPGNSDKPELSSTEQSILDAIDMKTQSPGFEVLIRVVASSNISQRAQAILSNVVSSFALFDAPGKNGFKYTPAKDMERFVTAYIMRFFPPESKSTILNSVELATLFHFPDQKNIPTSQLERQASKQVDGPRNIPEDGLLLGYNIFRGVKKPIRLDLEDRRRHMYVVGQTGVGKSVFLENLALQDMLNGEGFCFIDPHGDTAEKLISMVPKERTEDVIYFCPADMEYPMGLNLFEHEMPEQRDFLIQEAINMLYKLYDPQHQGIIGPRYEHWFRNAALTVMSNPEGGTFIDIPKVFTDNKYAKDLLKYVTDQTVLDFWNKEMASTSDYHKSEVLGWFVSKFGAFLSNAMMRNIIGQTKSTFNLREIMDNKKILIVNLSKGKTGDLNSKLLGMIFVMQFQAAAMSRANIPEEDRVDFCLYVDEFQNFSTDSFATIMSEARKYHLNLIVANQFTTQLSEEIRDAVFGNMGTIVSFRIGQNDVDSLTRYFQPLFDGDDLLRVPNWNAVVRTLVRGVPTQPFSMAGLPPLGSPNPKLGEALKQLSWAKFGRPKDKVEQEIFGRLATKEDPKPAFGQSPFAGANAQPRPPAFGASTPAQSPPKPPGTGSFLDEWMAKRKVAPAQGAAIASTVPSQPVSAQTQPFAQQPSAMRPTTSQPPMTQFGSPQSVAPTQQFTPSQPPITPLQNQNSSAGNGIANEAGGIAQQLKSAMSGTTQQSMPQQPLVPQQSEPPSINLQPAIPTNPVQAPPATALPGPKPVGTQEVSGQKTEDKHHRTEVELKLNHESSNGADDVIHIKRD